MQTQFKVEKMMCGGCSANVKKALADRAEIDFVRVDLEAKTVTIDGNIDTHIIANVISDEGYPATVI
jgi:copper chaperone CopZ